MNQVIDNLHLWVPNIFEFKGGIQVYSGFLFKALQELHAYRRLEVFLKHDKVIPIPLEDRHSTYFHAAGQWCTQLRTPAFAWQLASSALVQKPSLILSTHVNFTPVAHRLKQVAGIPYWTVAHGVDTWNINKPSLREALQGADQILAVSQYTRNRLLKEQCLNPERVVILPNTFNANQFAIEQKPQHLLDRYRLSREQPIILTVARLDASERYKGYDQILRALPTIIQTIPNVCYILVGKGNDRSRVEALVKDLGLERHIILTGFVPDEEIKDYYNLCDVFAMPSKGEGFGIVYLEALACGKPTVGGNQDGASDALCQGKLGVLVDPDNVTEIATTLTQILQKNYPHPLLYQPHALRQMVIDTFGFERFQQTLQTLLSSNLKHMSPSSKSNS